MRAEIASLMIGDELGVGHDPGNHASYVKSWIKVLKDDPKEILRAARDAEQINRYVLALEKDRALPEQGVKQSTNIDRPEPEKVTQRVASRGR